MQFSIHSERIRRCIGLAVVVALAIALAPQAVRAHHSYAMFDQARPLVVEGRVAKLEWKNPHVFLWLYVPKAGKKGEYDLWCFENGPIGAMTRVGWSKDVFKGVETARVHYFPLRDGRLGGYLIRLVRPDGSELIGDPIAAGVAKELAKTGSLPKSPSK